MDPYWQGFYDVLEKSAQATGVFVGGKRWSPRDSGAQDAIRDMRRHYDTPALARRQRVVDSLRNPAVAADVSKAPGFSGFGKGDPRRGQTPAEIVAALPDSFYRPDKPYTAPGVGASAVAGLQPGQVRIGNSDTAYDTGTAGGRQAIRHAIAPQRVANIRRQQPTPVPTPAAARPAAPAAAPAAARPLYRPPLTPTVNRWRQTRGITPPTPAPNPWQSRINRRPVYT